MSHHRHTKYLNLDQQVHDGVYAYEPHTIPTVVPIPDLPMILEPEMYVPARH